MNCVLFIIYSLHIVLLCIQMLSAEQTRDGQYVSKRETDSEVWATCVRYTSIAALAVLTSVFTAYVLPPADRSTLLPYWRTAVIYHIYPRSFQDSNNDGIGDLPGINYVLILEM